MFQYPSIVERFQYDKVYPFQKLIYVDIHLMQWYVINNCMIFQVVKYTQS